MYAISMRVEACFSEDFARLVHADALTLIPEGEFVRLEWLVSEESQAFQARLKSAASQVGLSLSPLTVKSVPTTGWIERTATAWPPVYLAPWIIVQDHHLQCGRQRHSHRYLRIQASQAFGTGQHATTTGCLNALVWLARRSLLPRRVYDLGCGSGILAIAASLLWPRASVIASDYDPRAISVARDHILLNRRVKLAHGAGGIGLVCCDGVGKESCLYDLVVANIMARPLISFAPQLRRIVKSGGYVILSGILMRQARVVIARYRSLGMTLQRWEGKEEWATLILRRSRGP